MKTATPRKRRCIELTLSDETMVRLDNLAKVRETSRSKIVDYAIECLVKLSWEKKKK